MNFALRLAQIHLAALEKEIAAAPVSEPPPYATTAELWRETGTFVTDDAFALSESGPARRGDLGVLTRHARPLSWLFFALREIPGDPGLPVRTDELAGRLADSANGFLAAHQPEGDDWRPLLLAVLGEARRALSEAAALAEGRAHGRFAHRRLRVSPVLAAA